MSDAIFQEKFARGQILQQQGRSEDAAAFFRDAISENPKAPEAFAQLAICQLDIEGQRARAVDTIAEAIKLAPESGYYHAVNALVLARRHRAKDSLAAADVAIRLDPDASFHYSVKAQAYLVAENWPEAESWARKALAIDADDGLAANLLAIALRVQGKVEETSGTIEKLLSDDPEDSLAHYNAGWNELQKSNYPKAEGHFREALRLDPEFDEARDGLLQCFKARSAFYRGYLSYCFFMQKFTGGAKWAMIIGIYLAFRFGRAILGAVHPAAAIALTVVYFIFLFWVWLASGIGNFLVWLDRSARHALKENEVREALAVGGGFAGGILVAGVAAFMGNVPLIVVGGAMVVAAVPASMTFTNDSKSGRRLFGTVTTYIYVAAIYIFITETFSAGEELSDISWSLIGIGALAAMICTWLGNVSSLRNGAED